MKGIIMLWLITAGAGISYSIIMERKRRINLLKSMEYCMRRMAYYVNEWRMPMAEVLEQVMKEEGLLVEFYVSVSRKVSQKAMENFGNIWKEESLVLLKREKIPTKIKILWQDLFLHMPMESYGVNKNLLMKCEELKAKREMLEAKYNEEQRLVVALGAFTGMFLCLILW